MEKLKSFARRLREPSTWAGVSILLTIAGVSAPVVAVVAGVLDVAPQLIELASTIGAAGAAATAVALPEKGESR